MSVSNKGATFRNVQYGLRVDRATALVPQTGNGAIFNVTGGRIILTGLMGVVTAAGSATVTNLKLRSAPSVGLAADIAANALVTSAAIGTLITMTGNFGDAVIVSSGAGQILDSTGVVLPIGALQVTTDASNATLSVAWTALWVPLEDAGVLTAA